MDDKKKFNIKNFKDILINRIEELTTKIISKEKEDFQYAKIEIKELFKLRDLNETILEILNTPPKKKFWNGRKWVML